MHMDSGGVQVSIAGTMVQRSLQFGNALMWGGVDCCEHQQDRLYCIPSIIMSYKFPSVFSICYAFF